MGAANDFSLYIREYAILIDIETKPYSLLISAYFLWSSWFCISVMLMTGLELILINFCCSFEAVMACNKLHQAI